MDQDIELHVHRQIEASKEQTYSNVAISKPHAPKVKITSQRCALVCEYLKLGRIIQGMCYTSENNTRREWHTSHVDSNKGLHVKGKVHVEGCRNKPKDSDYSTYQYYIDLLNSKHYKHMLSECTS